MADTETTSKPKIAIGPAGTAPSWDWIGVRTARSLDDSFEVELFDDFNTLPDVSIIMIVKHRPPRQFIEGAVERGIRLAYLPVDRYQTTEEIEADALFLAACDSVLSHSRGLLPYLELHARQVGFIEHESIYALESLAEFRPEGFVLWIGACEHLPHIIGWLEQNEAGADIKLLTNYKNKAARMEAHMRARRMGISLNFQDGTINGHETVLWSEVAQEHLMRTCKAAIDIKGADFNQATKPPTKAQQFIASGIPFSCNTDSSVAAYLKWRGFDVADAGDWDRLLSRDYWVETRAFAPKLRNWTSAAAVRRSYVNALQGLLGPTRHQKA